MSILIVEDNPISVKVLDLNLRKQGYATIMAQSGQEALGKLNSQDNIELIISDIMMPGMNGIQLLEKIKENSKWQGIPVIMCTALADMDIVKKAVELGCKHYVVKPLNIGQVMGKVREVLREFKPVMSPKSRIMSQLNLDEKAYADVVKTFTDLIEKQIDVLESLVEIGIQSDTITGLSDLYESASILGAEKICESIESIREESKTGDRDSLRSASGHLLYECKLVWKKIKENSESGT